MAKYCQFGEEAILRELLAKYEICPIVCDIGARWKGSNSAMLIREFGFKGLLVDANPRSAQELRKHLPEAEVRCQKVQPQDIEEIVPDPCGVLSIDVDGNDYWIWGLLNKKPQIVIIEFGRRAQGHMIAPYDPKSPKRKDGTSKLMFCYLAESKGYSFYKETGVNAIFVRNDL